MTEIEFPMYFSLVPTPGYNISYLESCGIDGEWFLFDGNWTGSAWAWGAKSFGVECSIKGTSLCKIRIYSNLNISVKMFWLMES